MASVFKFSNYLYVIEKAEHFRSSAFFKFGVKDGVRTRDLRNHNPAL